jgi:hypothetical protein
MARKKYGKTASGKPITEELVAELNQKAEAGFDTDEIVRRRGGRPPMGAAAATVESVRLDPELRQALAERARRDHETTSSVIRQGAAQVPRRGLTSISSGRGSRSRAPSGEGCLVWRSRAPERSL